MNPIYIRRETFACRILPLLYGDDTAAIQAMIDRGAWFTIENLAFDFNDENPLASNMDGVHLNGNCHHGVIRTLKGACYDDLVALNAHEGSAGPITHLDMTASSPKAVTARCIF